MKRLALVALAGISSAAQAACPGYSVCPVVNYPRVVAANPAALRLRNIVAQAEAATEQGLGDSNLNFGQLVALLGQALAFDTTLSANRTQACGTCHAPQSGFAGSLPAFARAGGIFPGADPRRTGFRAPQSLAYAGFAPVLAYRAGTGDFVGGNFWDSRATGLITGSPAADQGTVPLTNPFEMALPDPACAVRRVSQAPYAAIFGRVWSPNALAITWPANVDAVCARLNDGGPDQAPLRLSADDRARATLTVQQIGLTLAAWETSNLVSPFASKFDQVRAGTATFTAGERRGYALFNRRAHCSACHADTGAKPLFTDFTSANIGVPRNTADPFLTENAADAAGYMANPAGPAFIDQGLGAFLASTADTNAHWQARAASFMGAFQVPTLRNVSRPPGTVKSYMHNGYFTDLRRVVHFLNTRDVLPQCTSAAGVGVTCWPAPEQPLNVNHTLTGDLGLDAAGEADLVAFLGTLTDIPLQYRRALPQGAPQ